MSTPHFKVRRATLEDVGALMELWKSMHFDTEALARRVTEFQVALDDAGVVLGAAALQLGERQGLIHSEGFTNFALAEPLRELFWERFQNIAQSQGLLRLWTQERAPFWGRCGLTRAEGEVLSKLPAAWKTLNGPWLTLKLRDDPNTVVNLEKEFAVFMESEKRRTQSVLHQAKILHNLATLIAFVLLASLIAGGLYLLRNNLPFWHSQ